MQILFQPPLRGSAMNARIQPSGNVVCVVIILLYGLYYSSSFDCCLRSAVAVTHGYIFSDAPPITQTLLISDLLHFCQHIPHEHTARSAARRFSRPTPVCHSRPGTPLRGVPPDAPRRSGGPASHAFFSVWPQGIQRLDRRDF